MCLTATLISNQNNIDIYNVFSTIIQCRKCSNIHKKRLEELNIPQVNSRLKLFLITHNQQVNPINEIIFIHKCQEN